MLLVLRYVGYVCWLTSFVQSAFLGGIGRTEVIAPLLTAYFGLHINIDRVYAPDTQSSVKNNIPFKTGWKLIISHRMLWWNKNVNDNYRLMSRLTSDKYRYVQEYSIFWYLICTRSIINDYFPMVIKCMHSFQNSNT